jgi:2,3-dihydroxybenzoate decarboxylase
LKPAEIIRRNVAITTAGMFSESPLLCALRELGEDAVMFSVDHPFESMAQLRNGSMMLQYRRRFREKI